MERFHAVWATRAGGQGAGSITVRASATDGAGDAVIVGTFSNTVNFGTSGQPVLLTAVGPASLFVVKYRVDGSLLWVRRAGSGVAGDDTGAVSVDTSGNVVMAGKVASSASFEGSATAVTVPAASGGSQGFVVSYQSDGTPRWARTIGGAGVAAATGVAAAANGSMAVVGGYTGAVSACDLQKCEPLAPPPGTNRAAFVARFDTAGSLLWSTATTGAGLDAATAVAVDAAGDLFVTGVFSATMTLSAASVTSAVADAFVTRLSSAGHVTWIRPVGAVGVTTTAIAVNASGSSVSVGGSFTATSTLATATGSVVLANFGRVDGLALNFDGANGALQWAHSVGGVGSDSATAVALAPSGDTVVVGSYAQPAHVSGTQLTFPGTNSGYVVRVAATGGLVWSEPVGEVGTTAPAAVSIDPFGRVYVAGSFAGTAVFPGDDNTVSATATGAADLFLVRFDRLANVTPVATDQSIVAVTGASTAIELTATNASNGALTYQVTAPGPAHGTLSGTAPHLMYRPSAGYTGPDSFLFSATDPGGASSHATVSVTIVANAPPTTSNLHRAVAPNAAEPVHLPATDPNLDPLTFTTTTPAHGSLSGTAPDLVYTPTTGYLGPDQFSYTARDPAGATATGQVTFSVKRPNVVVILTDDQTLDAQPSMTQTNAWLAASGTSFSDAVVSFSECCPSRATLLTGQYAHNNGMLSSELPTGGVTKLDATNTLSTWLHDSGYYTSLAGKYFNGYGLDVAPSVVPPGWSDWYALFDPTTYNYYGYDVSANGAVEHHGLQVSDYSTDVLARHADTVIRTHGGGTTPLFVMFTPTAPHVIPYGFSPLPAVKYQGTMNGRQVPRTASFNEADVSDKPAFVRARPLLTTANIDGIDRSYARQLESLRSVDDAVAQIHQALADTGELDDTIVVFTSDNGFENGQHRFSFRKSLPYEEASRVPLIIAGPGFAANTTRNQPISNVDLAATIVRATAVTPRRTLDGIALQPVAADPTYATHRASLVENGPLMGRTLYGEIRTDRWTYTQYSTGESELYDLSTDPAETVNLAKDTAHGLTVLDLAKQLKQLKSCAGTQCNLGVP